jgi:hypothetical protein
VYSNENAFAALKNDGSVVTWGVSSSGGDSSSVSGSITSDVSVIYSTVSAFAALKSDGSAVTWGDSSSGGDSSSVSGSLTNDVSVIYSTCCAFAALKSDGSVVTWGDTMYGGATMFIDGSITSDVIVIYSNEYAFAALKSDGSVATWGGSSDGGSTFSIRDSLVSYVNTVYSTPDAFAALKSGGEVVTWGGGGGDSSSVSLDLQIGVIGIAGTTADRWVMNGQSFAALMSDGSVVTWGTSSSADSSAVSADLSSGVISLASNSDAFAALKDDGSVVTWGNSLDGGGADSSSVSGSLQDVTHIFGSTISISLSTTMHTYLVGGCPSGSAIVFIAADGTRSAQSASACTTCPVGTYSSAQSCIPCAEGTYAPNTGESECGTCGGGTYATGTGNSQCSACPAGSYGAEAPSTTCILCAVGTYAPGTGNTQCLDCEVATYGDADGLGECIPCPGGRLSPVGAADLASCVSPEVNFITGYILLCLIIPLAFEYVIHARSHRIAFVRQERVTKNIAKHAKGVVGDLFLYLNRARAERKRDFSRRVLKTWLFLLSALVLLLTAALVHFVGTLSQIFFRSMIMWKGFTVKFSFDVIMTRCVEAASAILNMELIQFIFQPVIDLFVWFSTFEILDVEAINITCVGAQAPIELFTNLCILSLTVLVIESDYQIFRAVTFNSVTDKFFASITQPCYQKWASREKGTQPRSTIKGWVTYALTLTLTLVSTIVGGFDFFQSFLQYCMSMVVQDFAPYHASTDQCNTVDNWEGTDSIIAFVATSMSYLLVVPALYEIAKVLVPGLPTKWAALDDVENKHDPKTSSFRYVKYLSFVAPDLWMASLSEGWVEYMRNKTPFERTLEKNNLAGGGEESEALHKESQTTLADDDEVDDDDLRNDNIVHASNIKNVKEDLPSSFRIRSTGTERLSAASNNHSNAAGFYIARAGYTLKAWALYPMHADQHSNVYVFIRIHRKSGRVAYAFPYDLRLDGKSGLCGGRGGAQLVTDMNETGSDHIVVLFTLGDLGKDRVEKYPGLLDAVVRCGGTKETFGKEVSELHFPAYCLIGVGGAGEGSGFERMQSKSKSAIIDVAFELSDEGFKLTQMHVDEAEKYYMVSSKSHLMSTMTARTEQENLLWKRRQKKSMPSYWTLCRLEMKAMEKWLPTLFLLPLRFLLVSFYVGHIFTHIGRRAFAITIIKYIKFFMVCLGIWDKSST